VNPAPTNIVQRAVALIDPGEDEKLRAQCKNAVHVALSMTRGSAKDIQRVAQRRGKPGKQAIARLYKVLQDLERAIGNPNLSRDLQRVISPDDLASMINRVNEERITTDKQRYPYKASKKLAAAEEAHHLLQQFHKKISMTKGSAFCKLAALLYGEPHANLQWTCRRLLKDKKLRS